MNRRCARRGHKWRQKVLHMLGEDVCTRRGCDAERTNPEAGWTLPECGHLECADHPETCPDRINS